MKFAGILLLGAVLSGNALAASVTTVKGDVMLQGDDGSVRALTNTHDSREAAISPDGQWVAHVRVPNGDDSRPAEIWLIDTQSNTSRKLLTAHGDARPKHNLTHFRDLAFSSDNRQLYFLTSAWEHSSALRRMTLTNSSALYLTPANDLYVIESGPWSGNLLVQRKNKETGVSSWFLTNPSGRDVEEMGPNLADALDRVHEEELARVQHSASGLN